MGSTYKELWGNSWDRGREIRSFSEGRLEEGWMKIIYDLVFGGWVKVNLVNRSGVEGEEVCEGKGIMCDGSVGWGMVWKLLWFKESLNN